jgi:RNA recognition motif-containing protein
MSSRAKRIPATLRALPEGRQMKTKLYVGNLGFSTTEQQLQAAFAAHGTLLSASIVVDRATGQSRGFAFVEYESADEANRAISALDGTDLDGRSLKVNIARPRRESTGGQDRGGRAAAGSGNRHGG